ncbi:MAG: peptide-methionine (R)-S-oxide reductase MsrB [Candidatus Eremiobacteraeota bacterium]|nr:peptide-methionine (R)-S-oxide reductase MsrB [Candidatus Eremiobacteraeota bacterium]MBC5826131.1 peptide-methionine (R)-S-oxide reductase MsrB [Candidatus Eremiobacteraeota bacterium]
MLTRRSLLGSSAALLAAAAAGKSFFAASKPVRADTAPFEVNLSDKEWRKRLTPAQYDILRQHGTEPPFSSPLDHERRPGTYACAGCDLGLYPSKTKFDSGTGWPSFYAPLANAVATSKDFALVMPRTEVHCRRCGGHLGHVFDDGPKPTGLRYCMNGLALTFHPA